MTNKSDTAPRFDLNLINSACGEGNATAIAKLSGKIAMLCDSARVALRDRQPSQKHPVIRDNEISDSEAANFAYRMLKACAQRKIPPPSELVDLFQIILKQDRPPHRRTRRWVQREDAQRYLYKNPNAKVRDIACYVNVAPSTVSRWLKDERLLR